MKLVHTRDMTCVPLSFMISSGMPKYRNTCMSMSLAVSKALRSLGKGIRHRDLPVRDLGRLVMKSTTRWDHDHCEMGKGISFPVGKALGILAWTHVGHDEMNVWISESILGHQYFFYRSLHVLCVPGCRDGLQRWCAKVISGRHKLFFPAGQDTDTWCQCPT